MRKALILVVLLSTFCVAGRADYADSAAKKVRKQRISKVILCGPKADQKEKTKALADVARDLKPKQVLRLLPGDYGKDPIEIKADGIIIESANPEKECQLSLVLEGDDCVVRNLNVDSLFATRNVTIVDSTLKKLYLRYSTRKAKQVVYNCSLNSLMTNPAFKEVFIKYVTTAHGEFGMEVVSMTEPKSGEKLSGELYLGKSVICGEKGAFYLEQTKMGNLDCVLQDCVFYGGKALILFSKKKAEMEKLSKLKSILNHAKQKGKILLVDPKFDPPGGFIPSKNSFPFKKKWGVKLNKKMLPSS